MKTLVLSAQEAKNLLYNPIYQQYWANPQKKNEQKVYFSLTPLSEIKHPSLLIKWLSSLRAISLTVMLTPTIAVLIYGLQKKLVADHYAMLTAVIIPCLLLLAVNLFNDVRDHVKLLDLPGSNGGSGVIQKGWLTPIQLRRGAIFLVMISLLLCLPILLKNLQLMIAVLLVTLIAVIGYSGRPFNLKYRALGDLTVFLMCGPLLTSAYALATFNYLDTSIILFGCLLGLMANGILHANNLNDIKIDQQAGAKTIAILLGFEKSKVYMLLLYLAALLTAIILSWLHSVYFLLPLLAAIYPAFQLLRKIFHAKSCDSAELADIRFVAPQIHLLTGILLCLAIFIFS